MMKTFTVRSVNLSDRKGVPKKPLRSIVCKVNTGVEGDGHAGPGNRQVSLLAFEDIMEMRKKGAAVDCGDFAENITTEGIDLASLPIGTELRIGKAVLRITQIGKTCHRGCAIMQQTGDCIMPRKGVFASVHQEGVISRGDTGTYGF